MSKLIINLKKGYFEIDSENDDLVSKIYTDFKTTLVDNSLRRLDPKSIESPILDTPAEDVKVKTTASATSKKSKVSSESYKPIGDLELWATGEKSSLVDFYKSKVPSTSYEKNTVFVYYLEKICKITGITAEHVYTCYKDVKEPSPGSLLQSLKDTNRRKGWLNTSNSMNIIVTPKGENFVEYELPRSKSTE